MSSSRSGLKPARMCMVQPHVCAQIEVVARRGDIHDTASLVARYQTELTQLRAELEALRGQGQGPC